MTDQAAPAVYLGDAREIQRVVAPITLQRRYEVGVAYAVRLADLWNLPVHLVSVDTEGSSETAADLMSGAINALEARHPGLRVDATIVTETSSAAADLADWLQPSDLVVMSTAADADPADSFAQEFVHLWAGPTSLLGPEVDSEASLEGDVVLGVDGSAMAERAVPIAVALAHLLGAYLWVVQAVDAATTDHVHRLRAAGETVSESAYIQDLVARVDDPTVDWVVVHSDDASAAIREEADQHRASFVVVATHGASGIARTAFGSTTVDIVRSAQCPVVVIRPVGLTPVAIAA